MIEGMESYVGRRLTARAAKEYGDLIGAQGYFVTRPDFYSSSTHINMMIHVDRDMRITDFSGDKCFSPYRGMYNRSGSVSYRDFTKRDLAYLRRFVKGISGEEKTE